MARLNEKWAEAIHDHVWSKAENMPQNNLDVQFRCRDGKISAHLSMLRFASKTISNAANQVDSVTDVILVPDFSIRTVSKSIELIYTGSVCLRSEFEIGQVMDFVCNRLAIDMMLDWSSSNESGASVPPPESPIITLDQDEDEDRMAAEELEAVYDEKNKDLTWEQECEQEQQQEVQNSERHEELQQQQHQHRQHLKQHKRQQQRRKRQQHREQNRHQERHQEQEESSHHEHQEELHCAEGQQLASTSTASSSSLSWASGKQFSCVLLLDFCLTIVL